MNTRAKQKQGYKSVKEVFPKENSRHELKSVKSEQQTTNNAQTPKRKPLRGYPDNNFSSNLRNDGFYPPIEHPRFEDESDKYEDMGKTFTDLKPVSYNETVENYNENIEEEDPLNNSLPGHSNSLNSSFSVTRSLQETMSLSNAMKEGNLLKVGQLLRRALQQNSLSEVQLKELACSLERPNIPLMSMLMANERSDLEDIKSFNAASLFLLTLPPNFEKPLKRLECSVNSLSHTIKESNPLEVLEHRETG